MTDQKTLDASSASLLSGGLEVIYSDADLTKIYNEANGLDPKRHNPITTERIFKAMRECLNIGEAMTSNVKLWGSPASGRVPLQRRVRWLY